MTRVRDLYEAAVAAGRVARDPAQAAVLPELDRIREGLEAAPRPGGLRGLFRAGPPEPVRGLYLWGGVGRGKSMLMDLFHDAVAIEAKRRVHFHGFMQEVQAGLNAARRRGLQDAVRPVADELAGSVRLLALDEMQVTDIADAMILGRLFQRLFQKGVTLVTTSNREPDALYKDGLNRALFLPAIALLKEHLSVRHLASATDHRQERAAGEGRWFAPADAAARAAIDRIWSGLTGGARPEPLVLTVAGRRVELPRHAAGAVRAGFWALCGRPLGPADYLAMAGAVDTLVLEDIPHLSAENYNEARRFVTLVDALYEARVRLVASAADEPDRLYIEGEGSFEFARTASRLAEMRSKGWGAPLP